MLASDEETVAGKSSENNDPIEDNPIPPELIEYVPAEKREEIIREIVLHEQYLGPLAHPRIAAGYERLLPGSVDRILTMAEEQQRHRLKQEDRGQQAAIERDKRGMNRGFTLAMALMLVSALAIYLGSDLVGFGMVATSVVSLAGVFLYSHHSTQQELREKREALQKPSSPPEPPQSEEAS
ncbi:MAG: DUF2335 domain-containing protein [Chloroflexi bacterium]|nr:DUF2335 domain-containing protein [Chloroflexota bacterium]